MKKPKRPINTYQQLFIPKRKKEDFKENPDKVRVRRTIEEIMEDKMIDELHNL